VCHREYLFFGYTLSKRFIDIGGKFFSGLLDTGNKLVSGVIDTGDKLGSGVIDTGDKLVSGVIDAGDKLGSGVIDTGDKLVSGVIDSFSPYENIKIHDMLFTSHNIPHITLGNEQWEFATLKSGAISPYLCPPASGVGLMLLAANKLREKISFYCPFKLECDAGRRS
jgi:hypothetical protein